MNVNLFKGKSVCISGATGGLGKALARKYANLGCNLLLIGRNFEKLNLLVAELQSDKIKVVPHQINLSIPEEVVTSAGRIIQTFGGIDILINAAGVFPVKSLRDTSIAEYQAVMSVNVTSSFILAKIFLPYMMSKRWVRIVNVGSSSSYNGNAETGAYCVSKHALLGLSRSLFQELKSENIRVFSISPGSMQTQMGEIDIGQDYDTFINPEEVADYIVYCTSFDTQLISEEIRLNRLIIQ